MEDLTGWVIIKRDKNYIISNSSQDINKISYTRNHCAIPTLSSKNVIATDRSHIVLPTATIKQHKNL